jgi:chorismate dehydratase
LEKRIRIGAVSYLNTLPLLHGLGISGLMKHIELVSDYPAKIARSLVHDEIDLGLVPVAVIPQLKESYIISDYCIGAEGEVASVAIFSEVPMQEIDTILLDYQSRTSVNLAKILIRDYWKQPVQWKDAGANFINEIKGKTAAVVIGDRALALRPQKQFIYDLATAWKAHTGLPFVFAAWVANKPLDPAFIDAFNRATGYGVKHVDEVLKKVDYNHYDLQHYFTQNISYELTEEKRKGLALFLAKIQSN